MGVREYRQWLFVACAIVVALIEACHLPQPTIPDQMPSERAPLGGRNVAREGKVEPSSSAAVVTATTAATAPNDEALPADEVPSFSGVVLPPLPAPRRGATSRYRSRSAPPACKAPLGWNGRACVARGCREGLRFFEGFGCERCVGACEREPRVAVYEEWSDSDIAFDEAAARRALATIDLQECMREDSFLYGSERQAQVHVSPRGAVPRRHRAYVVRHLPERALHRSLPRRRTRSCVRRRRAHDRDSYRRPREKHAATRTIASSCNRLRPGGRGFPPFFCRLGPRTPPRSLRSKWDTDSLLGTARVRPSRSAVIPIVFAGRRTMCPERMPSSSARLPIRTRPILLHCA